jgi:pimeloyl-ACP methyl ester carboxylesterase
MSNLFKKNKFLVIALCTLVISTLLSWGIASGFGNTKIQRFTAAGENGAKMSFVTFVPKSATNENPAPVMIYFPGRSSNSHQLDNWAIESARQGIVSITVDWNGNGETDLMSTQNDYVAALMDSVLDMPFVDKNNIGVLGNSAGNSAAVAAFTMYPENVNVYVDDVHPVLLGDLPQNANMLVIQAKADQYVNNFVGDHAAVVKMLTEAWQLDADVEEGKFYGSAADNTLKQYVITNTIHQISALDFAGMKAQQKFLAEVWPSQAGKGPNGLIVGWYQLTQILAYAGVIMTVLALGNTMYQSIPYFNAIGNAPTPNNGLRGGALTKNVIISLLIPLIDFFPVSWACHNAEFLNPIFQSRNLRGVIGWLLFNAIINLVIAAVKANKAKKNGTPMTAADFGMAGPGESVQWYKVGRAFLLACIVVAAVFAWVRFVETFMGINYQIWNVLNISEIPPQRFLKAIPFICCNIVIMLAANIGMNTTRRLADTGNPAKDMAKAVALNVLVSAGVVTFLLLVQYGIGWATTQYIMPQLQNLGGGGTSAGSLDFAFGFPLIMGFSAGMSTYFYKKTNNIWLGLFISAIFGGFVGVVGATFITGHAVM